MTTDETMTPEETEEWNAVMAKFTPEVMLQAMILMKEEIHTLYKQVGVLTRVLNAYCEAYPLPGLPGAMAPGQAASAPNPDHYRPGTYL